MLISIQCTLQILIFDSILSTVNIYIYFILVEGPGVARGKKNVVEKKKFRFFLAYNTPLPHECPQKISAQSFQSFDRL